MIGEGARGVKAAMGGRPLPARCVGRGLSGQSAATGMSPAAKRWVKFFVRWGIAIGGIAIVLYNISLSDRVLALGLTNNNTPVQVKLATAAPERITPGTRLQAIDPFSRQPIELARDRLVNRPDRKTVVLADGRQVPLLAMDLSDDGRVRRLLIGDPETAAGRWIAPGEVKGGFALKVPNPLVDPGLASMLSRAEPHYLWAAVAVFPIVFVITAYRWQCILRAVGIVMPLGRTFALNMVGAFYNSFMPGSTGGDLLKAYYAAKQTPNRTRAVLSVIVDRAIGLLALVILGGGMAAYSWLTSADPEDDATRKSMQVALGSAAILLGVAAGLTIYYVPALRRLSGLDFVLRRLPMQEQVRKAMDGMEMYRRRPGTVLGAIAMTFPVHATVVVSAMLCGMAFDLPLPWWYYFVAVPVIVLSGSIPISPQGAGVMEFFAIVLTRRQGCTIGQAFALTMSIRVVQMLWNLTGGFFVIRGGYHAPTEREQEALAADDGRPLEDPAAATPPATAAAGRG